MRGTIRFMDKTKIAHLKGILFTAFLFSLFIMLLGMRHYSQKRLFVLSFSGFLIAGMILDMAICHFPPSGKTVPIRRCPLPEAVFPLLR